MSLRQEMLGLVHALHGERIPYALCGGLAMAVHGWPRATMDIDLLVEDSRLDEVVRLAKSLGFTQAAGDITVGGGRVRIRRVVKFVGEDYFPLDFLVVTPDLLPAWESRTEVETADGPMTVVSRQGLIQMKTLRNSGTDQDDVRKLKGETGETR